MRSVDSPCNSVYSSGNRGGLHMFKRLVLILLVALPVRAEVVRVEVTSHTDVLAGKSFSPGAYEKLSGKIYFAVDPRNSANQIVTDIDKAPKNASGKVEFSSDFFIIKPKDLTRGNGSVLYEVSNRGNKGKIGRASCRERDYILVTCD